MRQLQGGEPPCPSLLSPVCSSVAHKRLKLRFVWAGKLSSFRMHCSRQSSCRPCNTSC